MRTPFFQSAVKRAAPFSIVLFFLVGLSGCGGSTAEEHYARAQTYVAQGEDRAAVVELRNAVQKKKEYPEARLLLGETRARLGDFPLALKEFERALDQGLDDDRVRLGLLETKVRLARYQEVIGELEGSGALSPAFAVVLADAYLARNDLDKAKALYLQGTDLSRGNLGLGIIAWQRGDLPRARRYLDEAIRLDPKNADAWLRKGELELSQRAFADAQAAFHAAAQLPVGRVPGRIGLARVLLLEGDLEGAAAEIDGVLGMAPQFPLGHYLSGLIRFEQGDLRAAKTAVKKVRKMAPDHAPSLYLLAAINYQQGEIAEAEENLQRVLALEPTDESAAKLLASIRFDREDLDGGLEILAPLQQTTDDPQILAMYGAAQLRQGNSAAATASLEKAVALAPDMASFRNQLALSLLSAGDKTRAEAALESAIEVDESQFQSDYLLAMFRLRDQDWDGVMAAANGLVAKSPDNPIGYNLQGAAALGKGDVEAAEGYFRAAVERDPGFLPAVRNLSRLAERNGNLAGARRVYQDVLSHTPGDEGALLGLADLSLRQSEVAAALGYLLQAADANPASVSARLGLARLYLATGQLGDARRRVHEARALAPGSPDLLLLQAEIDLRSGNRDAAARAAGDLQAILVRQSDNQPLLLAVGSLQARVGQSALARGNLERVLKLTDGKSVEALRFLARLDLQNSDLRAAEERLQQLRPLNDQGPEFELLQGDVRLASGDREGARRIYRQLSGRGVREGVVRLASLDLAADDVDRAIDRLQAWLVDNKEDMGAELLLADALLRSQETDKALSRYESLVETNNPVVLNNLAWLYMERGDVRAVEMARRAVLAAPDDPDVLDTLGWILLRQGEVDEALRLLRRSLQLKPGNPSVEYHLGIALRESGDLQQARSALERALEAGNFPEIQDAMQALRALPGA